MSRRPFRHLLPLAVTTAGFLFVNCTDSVGPTPRLEGRFGIAPMFESSAAGIVPIGSVRFVLNRSTDTLPARDTTITIAVGQDSVVLEVTVAMFSSGETFTMNVELKDTLGVVVFRGGPVPVTPSSGGAPPPVVPVPIVYVGVGSQAASVRITSPDTVALLSGDSTVLTAQALDSAGIPIPNTPIAWTSLDTTRAVFPAAGAGTVRARGVRGPAGVVATLLTGQADTNVIAVQPVPTAIAVQGGNTQTATVDSLLAQPLVARVTAADGLGVSGIWVRFTTTGGGTFAPDSALTDASGDASTTWRLGGAAGAQTATATTLKLAGASAAFSATATAGAPHALALNAGDGQTAVAGQAVAVAPSVVVTDARGNLVPNATVTFQVVSGGGTLTGATPASNAAGVATLGSWTLGAAAGANTIRAFIVRPTPAPVAAATVEDSLPVERERPTRDSVEQPAPAPEAAQADTVVVTFTATGIPGAATTLAIATGAAQADTAGATLADSLAVIATDANGNPVPGASVTWTVTAGGGSVSSASTPTDAAGRAAVRWTVGTVAGAANTVLAILPGDADTAVFSAAVSPATATQLAFATQPVDTVADATFPALLVQVRDLFGNVRTGDNATQVTMAIAGGTGKAGANLLGTLTRTVAAGVATFNDLTIDSASAGYALQATATGLAAATSSTFAIGVGAVASVTLAPDSVQLSALTATSQFTAVARDAGGNVVTGAPITWGTTDSAIATISGTGLVTAVANGTVSVIAASSGVADTSVLVVAQVVTQVVVTPALDTLQFAGDTVRFAAALSDALSQPVTGTPVTWGTTDTSIASIDGNGLVTAALAGTVSVIATSGGVADTATLVVGQTIGSVVIGPDTLTFTSLTDTARFTATAFDLGATPVPGAPLTWTSLSPAVATVDGNGLVTAVANGIALVEAASDSITDTAVVVVNQVATQLAFTVQPADTLVGATLTPAVTVQIQDALGQLVASATDSLTLALLDTTASGATLGGVLGIFAGGGVATWPDLTLDNPGLGFRLVVTGAGLTPDTSTTFDVSFPPGAVYWASPVSGDWNDPTKWNTGVVPTANDTVLITVSGNYVVTVSAGITVKALEIGGVSGNQALAITAGTFNVDSSVYVGPNATFQQASSIAGTGDIVVDGTYDWLSGAASGSGTTRINAGGQALLSGSGGKSLSGRLLENAGLFQLGGTADLFLTSTDLINEAGGTLELNSTNTLNYSSGTVNIRNYGTLDVLGGAIYTLDMTVVDSGVINLPAGTVELTNAPNHVLAGTANFTGGLLRVIGGTLTLQGTWTPTGAPRVQVTGGTLTLGEVGTDSLRLPDLLLNGGTLTGPGLLEVSDSLQWTTTTMSGTGTTRILPGAIARLTGASSRTLTGRLFENQGLLALDGTADLFVSNTDVVNTAGGVVEFRSTPTLNYSSGTVNVRNYGTFDLLGGATYTLEMTFVDSGVINVPSGALELTFASNHVLAGTTNFTGGLLRVVGGGVTIQNGWTPTGAPRVQVTGGTLTLGEVGTDSLRLPDLLLNGGTLTGPGLLEVSDSLQWTTTTMSGTGTTRILPGAIARLTGASSRTLTGRLFENQGLLALDGTADLFISNTDLRNALGATIELRSSGTLNYSSGIVQLRNFGTIDHLSGVTNVLDMAVVDSGVINLPGGTLQLSATTNTLAGTINFSGGLLLVSGGSTILTNDLVTTGADRWQQTGGTLTIGTAATDSIVLTDLLLNGGTLTGPGLLEVSDSLQWTTTTMQDAGRTRILPGAVARLTGASSRTLTGRLFENQGLLALDGTADLFISSTDLRNALGATIELRSSGTLNYSSGIVQLRNFGTIDHLSGVTNVLDMAVVDSGVINLPGGTLQLSATTNTLAGTINFSGGLLLVSGGSTILTSDLVTTGADRWQQTGGTLTIGTAATDSIVLTDLLLNGGTLTGPGLLEISDSLQWTTTTMQDTGRTRILPGAVARLTGASSRTLTGRGFENFGLFALEGSADLFLSGSPLQFINDTSGTVELRTGASFNASSGSPQLVNKGTFIKTGVGTTSILDLPLTTTAGIVDVQDGTLDVNSGFSLDAASQLLGNGVLDLAGAVTPTINGTIDPGASPGRLTIVGNVTFPATAILIAEANSAIPVTGHDQLVVQGTLTQGGTLDVQWFYAPSVGDRLAVLVAETLAGAFTSINLADTIPGIQLDTLTVVVAGGPDTLLVLAQGPAFGTTEWRGTVDGDWTNSANWVGGVPGAADTVFIAAGRSNYPTLTGSTSIAAIRVETGASLTLNTGVILTVAQNVEAGFTSIDGAGTVRLTGAGATVAGKVPNLDIASSVSPADSVRVTGTLTVSSGGHLTLAGRAVRVEGDFSTAGTGLLTMNNAADTLAVAANVTFAGGGTTLTNGHLLVGGDFTQDQTNSVASFATTNVNHTTVFNGTGTQTVTLQSPVWLVAPTVGQAQFGSVRVTTPDSLKLASTVPVNGGLVLTGSTALVAMTADDTLRARGGLTMTSTSSIAVPLLDIAGTLEAPAGAAFAVDTVLVGNGAFTIPDTLNYNVLLIGRTTIAGTDPTASLRGPTTVTGQVRVEGRSGSGASLTINGHTLDVGGDLLVGHPTLGRSWLVMTNALDSVIVRGNATFRGGTQLGTLTAGTLLLHGDFTQVKRVNQADNFVASGSHTTVLGSGGASLPATKVFFESPDSSRFANLVVNAGDASGGLHLQSDVVALGTFSGTTTAASVSDSAAGFALRVSGDVTTTAGIQVADLEVGGSLSADSASYNVGNTIFAGTTQTIPVALPYQALTVNGTASAAGPLALGAGLTVGPSGELDISTHTVTVPSNVAALGSGVIGTSGRVIMTGGPAGVLLQGTFPNLEIQDSVVMNGPTSVGDSAIVSAGTLDFAGQKLDVSGGAFVTRGTGVIIMGQPSDSLLTLTGVFRGGSTNGRLTDGRLVAYGNLTLADTGNAQAFYATGSHVTEWASPTAPTTMVMGSGAQLQHLDVTGGANNTMPTAMKIAGNVTVRGGQFSPWAAVLIDIGGNLSTEDSGSVLMVNFATIRVGGNASFDGAASTALQSGTLNVLGNFTQLATNSDSSFAPDSSFTTILRPSASISFATPGPSASRFGHLRLTRSASQGDSVRLMSSAYAHRVSVQDSAVGGPVILGGPGTLTVRDSLILSGVNFQGAVIRPRRVDMQGVLHFTASANNTFEPDTAIFLGVAGQVIPSAGNYKVLVSRGDSVVLGSFFSDSLTALVVDSGVLDAANANIGLDSLITRSAGRLRMADSGATFRVWDAARFAGGSTVGSLTNGLIEIYGNFIQENATSARSFFASGAHTVRITGQGDTSSITFATPDTAAGSAFSRLDLFRGPAAGGGGKGVLLEGIVPVRRWARLSDNSGDQGLVIHGQSDTLVVGDTLSVQATGAGVTVAGRRIVTRGRVLLGGTPTLAPDTLEIAGAMELPAFTGYQTVLITDSVYAPRFNQAGTFTSLIVGGTSGVLVCDTCLVTTDLLATRDNGALRYAGSGGTLTVDTARFGGGPTDSLTGRMNIGSLIIWAALYQDSTNSTRSFAPSGGHFTTFRGTSGVREISFQSPDSTKSHFANFRIWDADSVSLLTPVFARTRLSTVSGQPVRRLMGNGNALVVSGLDADSLVMDSLPIRVVNGAPITRFNVITFENMNPGVNQLEVRRVSGAHNFFGFTFSTVPSSGANYVLLQDTDGLTSFLTITFGSALPLSPDPYHTELGGALLSWNPIG